MIRKIIILILFISLPLPAFGETADTEVQREILKIEPKVSAAPPGEKVYVGASFDYGVVDLPSTGQTWTVATARGAFLYKGLQLPYFQFSRHQRGSDDNYTYDLGGYYRIKRCYLNLETGFGSHVSYIYKNKAHVEFSHPLIGNLYMKEKYRFLKYSHEYFNVLSPGLTYYFGNSYIDAEYDASISSDRGTAQWGALRINYNLFNNFNVLLGSAVGERLYDILGSFDPSDAFGFIVYGGIDAVIIKNLFLRLTLLYGEERPSFHHRSIITALSYKF